MSRHIHCTEWERFATKNTLSRKVIIQNRRLDKEFPIQKKKKATTTTKQNKQTNKQKLKEFVTIKTALPAGNIKRNSLGS